MDHESIIKVKINNILNNNIHNTICNTHFVDITNIDTLVLSGGGVKGLHYIGIIKKLEELNVIKNIKTIAGSSIGAFFGALITIGFSYKELYDFILLFNISKIKHADVNNFFSYFGIDNGNNLEIILNNMFISKGFDKNISFNDLYHKTNIDLIITGVCINEKKCYYFSHQTFPNMSVIKALRISTSIPIYFTPVLFQNKLWVDGGVINNYPIDLFKNNLNKTLGIYLAEKMNFSTIDNLENYFICIIHSLIKGLSDKSINGFENNTIIIKSNVYNVIDTNFSHNKLNEFVDIGYKSISLN